MHLGTYLLLLGKAENTLAESYRQVATGHPLDFDVCYACQTFAEQCEARSSALKTSCERYSRVEPEPQRLHPPGLTDPRSGPVGLLRDLQDLHQLSGFVAVTWTLIDSVAQAARDRDLMAVAARYNPQISAQMSWLQMRINAEAPQALLVGYSAVAAAG